MCSYTVTVTIVHLVPRSLLGIHRDVCVVSCGDSESYSAVLVYEAEQIVVILQVSSQLPLFGIVVGTGDGLDGISLFLLSDPAIVIISKATVLDVGSLGVSVGWWTIQLERPFLTLHGSSIRV
jgi:hypothetical protein